MLVSQLPNYSPSSRRDASMCSIVCTPHAITPCSLLCLTGLFFSFWKFCFVFFFSSFVFFLRPRQGRPPARPRERQRARRESQSGARGPGQPRPRPPTSGRDLGPPPRANPPEGELGRGIRNRAPVRLRFARTRPPRDPKESFGSPPKTVKVAAPSPGGSRAGPPAAFFFFNQKGSRKISTPARPPRVRKKRLNGLSQPPARGPLRDRFFEIKSRQTLPSNRAGGGDRGLSRPPVR